MANRSLTSEQLKQTGKYNVRNSVTNEIDKTVYPNDIQIGVSDSSTKKTGLIFPAKDAPSDTSNKLYNENGTLKFDGAPIDSSGIDDSIVATISGSTFRGHVYISSSFQTRLTTKSTTYTVEEDDYHIAMDCSAGPKIVNLFQPTVALIGKELEISDSTGNSTANVITITGSAGTNFNISGGPSVVINSDWGVLKLKILSANTYIITGGTN